jgi:glycine cleavage system H protein
MSATDIRYSQEHEWVQLENDIATIGISSYAIDELGEIVFVELPEIGDDISQMTEFGSIESVKTVSSLFLPVGGQVVEVNSSITDSPENLNNEGIQNTWLIKIKISDTKEFDDLMTEPEYKTFLDSL